MKQQLKQKACIKNKHSTQKLNQIAKRQKKQNNKDNKECENPVMNWSVQ